MGLASREIFVNLSSPNVVKSSSVTDNFLRNKMCNISRLGLIAASSIILICRASAEWTLTPLNPSGALASQAFGADGGQQVGDIDFDNSTLHASIWSATGSNWVDLTPPTITTQSYVRAAAGGHQAGFFVARSHVEACMWSGTAASFVILHPQNVLESRALAIGDGQQVGYVRIGPIANQTLHASLWNGTSESWVNLNPSTSSMSFAYAVSGGQQGGGSTVAGNVHATLWHGTAASWVDLNPTAGTSSMIYAIAGNQQAGYAHVSGQSHASLWSRTATSWVELNPRLALSSEATALNSEYQVGFARVNGITGACLWSGNSDSWQDLHHFLPAKFDWSQATGISSDGVKTYITGFGHNTETNRYEAFLWTQPVPETSTSGAFCAGIGLLVIRRVRK
jgi:hypothetical protein